MKIVGQLKAILGLDKSKFDQGLKDAEKSTNAFGNVVKKIGGFIVAAFSVGALVNFSKESMKLASTAEGIRTAFERLNKPNLLDQLRKATRGTVTDVSLMQKAVQANNFKIPLEQLATFFEFATNRAIQTGESVDYLVDSIVRGIGRKSGLVMDNLGISLVELQQEIAKTGDFVTASGNIIKRGLTDMGDVADTSATKMAQFAVAGESLKEAWGTWLNKSPVINAFRSYFTDLLKAWADESNNFAQKAAMLLPYYGGQKGEKKIWRKGQKKTEEERAAEGVNPAGATGLEKLLKNAQVPAQKTQKTIADLRAEIAEYKEMIESTTVSDQARRNELLKQIKAMEDLITKYTTLEEKLVRAEAITKAVVPAPGLPGLQKPQLPGLQPGPAIDDTLKITRIDEMTAALEEQRVAVDILSSSFDALFSSSEDGFQAMFNSIISGLKRLVAELLARAAILTFLNIITGGFAGAAKGVFSAAYGSMFARVPAAATGGTVPPGYANDTYPAMLSSGETVLTASQSRNLSRQLDVRVSGTILNRDIALAGRRTQFDN